MNDQPLIVSDEATDNDLLNRTQYAKALARIAETASPPLVVGLYGDWGIGKTTLMRLIDKELNKKKTRSIWFDPWQHQHDDSPVISLVHTMVSQLKLGEQGRKLLTIVASAFGSMLLKATTTLNISDINEIASQYENERFQVREAQVHLREHFSTLIEKARGGTKRRLVFFIDDLDRCSPRTTLSVLEALKLYFNLDGCVYFLGVDPTALKGSIQHHYGEIKIDHSKYLDKIVQLPFVIPPIPATSMQDYLDAHLSNDLKPCEELLINCLGDNPRSVKRFINLLAFNHQLALQADLPYYEVSTLAALLLVQYMDPDTYMKIAAAPDQIEKIYQSQIKAGDNLLRDVFNVLKSHAGEELYMYLYFTEATTRKTEAPEIPIQNDTKQGIELTPEFMKPVKPSNELATIVGKRPLPRTEVTKKLWAYIKKNKLQDKENKRMINADEKLKIIFEGKTKVSMFDMTKLISKHLK